MIGIKNGFLCKTYSTCNSNMTRVISYIESIHPSLGADESNLFEVSDPVPVHILSMVIVLIIRA